MTITIRSTARLLAALAAVSSFAALAQTAAEPPTMNCPNPGSSPLDRASPDMNRFQKRVEEYKVCVNTYAASTGAKANDYAAQSKTWSDAANKAIDDYNAYVTKLNEATKSPKGGAEKN